MGQKDSEGADFDAATLPNHLVATVKRLSRGIVQLVPFKVTQSRLEATGPAGANRGMSGWTAMSRCGRIVVARVSTRSASVSAGVGRIWATRSKTSPASNQSKPATACCWSALLFSQAGRVVLRARRTGV